MNGFLHPIRFSLAKTFLQSYQGNWRNLSARILLESDFFLYFYYPSKSHFRKVMGGMGVHRTVLHRIYDLIHFC